MARERRLEWFREAKYGLFIHWGLYAIPAGQWNGKRSLGLGEWVMLRSAVPVKEYEQLATPFGEELGEPGARGAKDVRGDALVYQQIQWRVTNARSSTSSARSSIRWRPSLSWSSTATKWSGDLRSLKSEV